MARDIGFTITVKGTDQQLKKIGLLEQELKRLGLRRGELLKQAKVGIGLTKEEQIELGKLNIKVKELRDQQRKTTNSIRDANKEIKSATGSYNQLVLQNKRLVEQLRKLPDPLGKNRKQFKALSGQINTNTDRLKKMDDAMGRQQRNVGNYTSAIGGLKNSFIGIGVAIGAAVIAFMTFSRITGSTISTIKDFAKSFANVITLLSVADVGRFRVPLRNC